MLKIQREFGKTVWILEDEKLSKNVSEMDKKVLLPKVVPDEHKLVNIWYEKNENLVESIADMIKHKTKIFHVPGYSVKIDEKAMYDNIIKFLYKSTK